MDDLVTDANAARQQNWRTAEAGRRGQNCFWSSVAGVRPQPLWQRGASERAVLASNAAPSATPTDHGMSGRRFESPALRQRIETRNSVCHQIDDLAALSSQDGRTDKTPQNSSRRCVRGHDIVYCAVAKGDQASAPSSERVGKCIAQHPVRRSGCVNNIFGAHVRHDFGHIGISAPIRTEPAYLPPQIAVGRLRLRVSAVAPTIHEVRRVADNANIRLRVGMAERHYNRREFCPWDCVPAVGDTAEPPSFKLIRPSRK